MDNQYYYNGAISGVGIPYDDIKWFEIEGSPSVWRRGLM